MINGQVSGKDVIDVTDPSQKIPEFPSIAIPIVAILGLAFMFQRRKE